MLNIFCQNLVLNIMTMYDLDNVRERVGGIVCLLDTGNVGGCS